MSDKNYDRTGFAQVAARGDQDVGVSERGPRGVMRGVGLSLVAAVRAVYRGSVKKLGLKRHGRNASASVGTVTVNGC